MSPAECFGSPISLKKEESPMKNTHAGKITTQILSVILCAAALLLLCCYFQPYFTITREYNKYLDKEVPLPDHYTLVDVIWCNTKPQADGKMTVGTDFSVTIIRKHFEAKYGNFVFNDYVTNLVLNFIFAIALVVTAIWFAANEFRKFPSMTSAIFTHICGMACGLFGLLGFGNNAMLDLGVEKFMYIRSILLILSIVVLVLSIVRFVIWLLTTLQLHKEKKARLALL